MLIQMIRSNWDSILVILAFLAGMVLLIRFGGIELAKRLLLDIVFKVEGIYGGKTGPLKHSDAFMRIYNSLPKIVRFFLTVSDIDSLIKQAVEQMKKLLSENPEAAALLQKEADKHDKG